MEKQPLAPCHVLNHWDQHTNMTCSKDWIPNSFGSLALLNGSPQTASAVALTNLLDLIMWRIHCWHFTTFYALYVFMQPISRWPIVCRYSYSIFLLCLMICWCNIVAFSLVHELYIDIGNPCWRIEFAHYFSGIKCKMQNTRIKKPVLLQFKSYKC